MQLPSGIYLFIRNAFIFLFVYTASTKFLEYRHFTHVLEQSPLIGHVAALAAWLIPAAELLTAGLLFFVSTRRAGMFASPGLMTVFTAYVLYMLLYVPNLPCSCGGVIGSMNWQQHLAFNIFFLCLALLYIATEKRQVLHRIAGHPT